MDDLERCRTCDRVWEPEPYHPYEEFPGDPDARRQMSCPACGTPAGRRRISDTIKLTMTEAAEYWDRFGAEVMPRYVGRVQDKLTADGWYLDGEPIQVKVASRLSRGSFFDEMVQLEARVRVFRYEEVASAPRPDPR